MSVLGYSLGSLTFTYLSLFQANTYLNRHFWVTFLSSLDSPSFVFQWSTCASDELSMSTRFLPWANLVLLLSPHVSCFLWGESTNLHCIPLPLNWSMYFSIAQPNEYFIIHKTYSQLARVIMDSNNRSTPPMGFLAC